MPEVCQVQALRAHLGAAASEPATFGWANASNANSDKLSDASPISLLRTTQNTWVSTKPNEKLAVRYQAAVNVAVINERLPKRS